MNIRAISPIFFGLVLVTLTIACASEDPAPTSTVTAAVPATPTLKPDPTPTKITKPIFTPTPRPSPTATAIPTPLPTPTPTVVVVPTPRPTHVLPTAPPPTPLPSQETFSAIDGDTTWDDIQEILGTDEWSCLIGIHSETNVPILDDSEYVLEHEVAMFSCLDQSTARALFFEVMMADLEEDELLNKEEKSCVWDLLAGMDVVEIMTSMAYESEDPLPMGEFLAGFVKCSTGWFVELIVGETGSMEELDPEQVDCIEEVLSEITGTIMTQMMREEETPELLTSE